MWLTKLVEILWAAFFRNKRKIFEKIRTEHFLPLPKNTGHRKTKLKITGVLCLFVANSSCYTCLPLFFIRNLFLVYFTADETDVQRDNRFIFWSLFALDNWPLRRSITRPRRVNGNNFRCTRAAVFNILPKSSPIFKVERITFHCESHSLKILPYAVQYLHRYEQSHYILG